MGERRRETNHKQQTTMYVLSVVKTSGIVLREWQFRSNNRNGGDISENWAPHSHGTLVHLLVAAVYKSEPKQNCGQFSLGSQTKWKHWLCICDKTCSKSARLTLYLWKVLNQLNNISIWVKLIGFGSYSWSACDQDANVKPANDNFQLD